MIITIIFVIFSLTTVISFLTLFINTIKFTLQHIKKTDKTPTIRQIKKNTVFLLASCLLSISFIALTQLTASTPAIRDADGNKSETAIAELRQVSLNGRKEWISIRGNDINNPILLFLAGGPGGSQMAAVRHDLAELEKHFIVVNWDQAGSGKSYGSGSCATGTVTDATADSAVGITMDTYINDGYELTKYLCATFSQEKIYLIGESWGSALGIFLIDKAPELYRAFIGTGQMVSFLDTEIIDYELAMEIAKENGDTETIETLQANGRPPYYGKDVTWKSAAYLQYLNTQMASNPEIHNSGYNTFRDLFSSEYGILDKINYFRGIVATFNSVYPQLYNIDLREDYQTVEVPVYFFLGRHDLNAPTSLAEEYYSVLNAPHKEIIWFEHSGHSPWINESSLFVEQVLRVAGIK